MADAVLRAVQGIDTNNTPLFHSAWATATPSAAVTFTLRCQTTTRLDAITAAMMPKVGPMDTMHYISNLRIDYEESADIATATAYAQNYHFRPGDGRVPGAKRLLTGGVYYVEVLRDNGKKNGVWRLTKWEIKAVWTQGDWAVMD